MAQSPATSTTRYRTKSRPNASDGYPQRIEIWDALHRLGEANRGELFSQLKRQGHRRPKDAKMDETYVRIELTDMCKRGFIIRVLD